jgi:hypothetical protein
MEDCLINDMLEHDGKVSFELVDSRHIVHSSLREGRISAEDFTNYDKQRNEPHGGLGSKRIEKRFPCQSS